MQSAMVTHSISFLCGSADELSAVFEEMTRHVRYIKGFNG